MNLQLCHSLHNFPKEAPTGNRAVTSSGSSFSRAAAARGGAARCQQVGQGSATPPPAPRARPPPARHATPGYLDPGPDNLPCQYILFFTFGLINMNIGYQAEMASWLHCVAFPELINRAFLCVSSEQRSFLGWCLWPP